MTYGAIRLVLAALICIAIMKVFKANKKIHKLSTVIVLAIFICLSTVFYLTPLENSFFSFDSAESAFTYSRFGSVIGTQDGKDTVLVVYESDSGKDEAIVMPKTDDGYKLAKVISPQDESAKSYPENRCVIRLYSVDYSGDMYAVILGEQLNTAEITDSNGSAFQAVPFGNSYVAYAYIGSAGEHYSVNINGVEFAVKRFFGIECGE